MAFTAQDVKTLREMTGCGMMDCKNALNETDGNMDKAVEFLREKGLATAAKKAGRIAAEGMVNAAIYGNIGVALEVNSETDFVAKNPQFQAFVEAASKAVADANPADVDALLAAKLSDTQTVGEALVEKISTIGENMNVRRFARYEGANSFYVHGGGRIAILVNYKLGDDSKADSDAFRQFGKDVAMQISVMMPKFVNRDEISTGELEKEKEILRAKATNEGKPAEIIEKMLLGQVQKFYKEICLIDQEYIKDDKMTIGQLLKNTEKEIGTTIEIVKFTRYEKGEGLEKKEDDFAAEIAKMTSK